MHTIAYVLNNDVRGGGSMPTTHTATPTTATALKPSPLHRSRWEQCNAFYMNGLALLVFEIFNFKCPFLPPS